MGKYLSIAQEFLDTLKRIADSLEALSKSALRRELQELDRAKR